MTGKMVGTIVIAHNIILAQFQTLNPYLQLEALKVKLFLEIAPRQELQVQHLCLPQTRDMVNILTETGMELGVNSMLAG